MYNFINAMCWLLFVIACSVAFFITFLFTDMYNQCQKTLTNNEICIMQITKIKKE